MWLEFRLRSGHGRQSLRARCGYGNDGSVVCRPTPMALWVSADLGLISRSGIIPIAHSQDTAGPMARTVRDAAILLNALAAPIRVTVRPPRAPGRSRGLHPLSHPNGLRGARHWCGTQYFGSVTAWTALWTA